MPDLALAYLKNLVEIPSVSGDEVAIATYCEAQLLQAGFRVERQPVAGDRFNVLAEKHPHHPEPGALPALLLYAHLDTVPPDPRDEQPAFTFRHDHARAYGLGVSDMKGGVALILAALQDFEPVGYRLKVALGVDEERDSQGAWTLVRSGWCDDVALALVPELSIDSPQEHLGLGRSGSLGFVLTSRGRRQHGAIPLQEPSAIMRGLQALQAFASFPLLSQEPLPERLVIHGLQAQAEGLTHPDTCVAHGHVFLGPQRPSSQVLQALQDHLAHHEAVTLNGAERSTPVAEAYVTDPKHPAVQWIQSCYQDVFAQPLPLAYGCSVADENVLASACQGPVLGLAPVGGNAHRQGEWIELKSLGLMVSLYQKILQKAGLFFA